MKYKRGMVYAQQQQQQKNITVAARSQHSGNHQTKAECWNEERREKKNPWLLYSLIYFAYFHRHHHHFTWNTLNAVYASSRIALYKSIHIYQHSKWFSVYVFALLEYSIFFSSPFYFERQEKFILKYFNDNFFLVKTRLKKNAPSISNNKRKKIDFFCIRAVTEYNYLFIHLYVYN